MEAHDVVRFLLTLHVAYTDINTAMSLREEEGDCASVFAWSHLHVTEFRKCFFFLMQIAGLHARFQREGAERSNTAA